MTGRNLFALLTSFVVLFCGTIALNFAIVNHAYLSRTIYWCILAIIFMHVAFELFHTSITAKFDKFSFFTRGIRGLIFDLAHFLLAIGLTAASFVVQPGPTLSCGGRLGAGFPIAFICDVFSESPIADWGNMSWLDQPNFIGIFIDILFFATLLWLIYLVVRQSISGWRRSGISAD